VEAVLDAQSALGAPSPTHAAVLEQARRTAELAESRYRGGAESLLALLDARRTL